MDKEKNQSSLLLVNVQRSIVSVRGKQIIIDADATHLMILMLPFYWYWRCPFNMD